MTTNVRFGFAVYYLPVPLTNPSAVLRRLLKGQFTNIQHVAEIDPAADGVFLWSQMITNAEQTHPAPSLESLRYFGRGLTREEAVKLQTSSTVYLLGFGYRSNYIWSGMKLAVQLTEAFAGQTGGIIWDDETREAFSVEEWHSRRASAWDDTVPTISKHTTMHGYNDGEFARAITLGMAKFGLPDIVVEDFAWSENRPVGNLINIFAQAIAEGAAVTKAGEFDLDLRMIKAAEVREPQLASLKEKATGKAKLTLLQGTREKGDPQNRLIQLGFSRNKGRDLHAKRENLLATMFGTEESVSRVKHNEELLAASKRAKEKLPQLQAAFQKGLQPGENIQLKAPFAVPGGGQEFMWVEVTTWQGRKIKGLLRNEPVNIPGLHGGQIVEVNSAEVFDYLRVFADGRQEGNETGAIIQRLSGSSP